VLAILRRCGVRCAIVFDEPGRQGESSAVPSSKKKPCFRGIYLLRHSNVEGADSRRNNVARARDWMSHLMLHAPTPLRSLRSLPVIGNIIHRLSHWVLPVDERVWARVEVGPAEGLWLELNPRTGQNYLRGDAENAVQRILEGRLRPGMVFYDLGANIGFFTLLAARLVGMEGRVFSFEPDPAVAARLRRNIERNQFSNVTVMEAGVWSSTGNVEFVSADSSSPDRGVGKFVLAENGVSGTPTPGVALDDFAQSAPPPNAIKCDVEGAEIQVLHGAERLLRAHHPWIICEVHSEENDRNSREYLRRLSYRVDSVDANHILAEPL
jgi:FkbM family methyltransferase